MQNTYLITYDLKTPGRDYRSLYDAIGEVGEARHSMQNVWFVKSGLSAADIREHLTIKLDSNDILFVAKLGAWASLRLEDAKWLKE